MSLYNCKTEIDREGTTHYRITKFTPDLDVESSYLVGRDTCECPGFERRQRCRHTEMLPRFIAREATDGQAFYNHDHKRWIVGFPAGSLVAEGGEVNSSIPEPTPAPRPSAITLRRL